MGEDEEEEKGRQKRVGRLSYHRAPPTPKGALIGANCVCLIKR